MKRVPWEAAEDEYLIDCYADANGGFISRYLQTIEINNVFHNGKNVRSESSVRRREIKLLSQECPPNAKDQTAGEDDASQAH